MLEDILLVSFGAVLGANTRFILFKKFESLNINKHITILTVNTLASFFLGLFISILPRVGSDTFSNQLALFFTIGFLGSLSTFSTFIYDLFDMFLELKIFRAIKLFLISLTYGIIALAFGFFLGK